MEGLPNAADHNMLMQFTSIRLELFDDGEAIATTTRPTNTGNPTSPGTKLRSAASRRCHHHHHHALLSAARAVSSWISCHVIISSFPCCWWRIHVTSSCPCVGRAISHGAVAVRQGQSLSATWASTLLQTLYVPRSLSLFSRGRHGGMLFRNFADECRGSQQFDSVSVIVAAKAASDESFESVLIAV